MHGLGNDYIYVDCTDGTLGGNDSTILADDSRLADLSVRLSDRHTGIGGDGIILILPSEVADFRMRIFNADGSEAKMCGNGSRCVGKYVYDNGLTEKTLVALETLSGVKYLQLSAGADGKVAEVTVDMGEPELTPARIPVAAEGDGASNIDIPFDIDGNEIKVTAVSM
ncbi:MAG: diaminopimelate epimerase, partial [Muribaculaceae bacterium]|nr:diaminopimelate epimerase [Muribaculaceae bacterium]